MKEVNFKKSGVKVTDIAKMADVSPSTVDRVINGRPGVHPKTETKIKDILSNIDLSNLEGVINLGFILHYGPNEYMAELKNYIDKEYGYFLSKGFRTVIRQVNTFEEREIVNCALEMASECSVIVIYGIDHPMIRDMINQLSMDGINVYTMISDISYSLRKGYFGINNHMAGRLAGFFMGRFLEGRKGKIALVSGSSKLHDHLLRVAGFKQSLKDNYPDLQVLTEIEAYDNHVLIEDKVLRFLKDQNEILGIYNVGAGNGEIVKALDKQPNRSYRIKIVGHELTSNTRGLLLKDKLDLILHQDYRKILDKLFDIASKTEYTTKNNIKEHLVDIDIYCKENILTLPPDRFKETLS